MLTSSLFIWTRKTSQTESGSRKGCGDVAEDVCVPPVWYRSFVLNEEPEPTSRASWKVRAEGRPTPGLRASPLTWRHKSTDYILILQLSLCPGRMHGSQENPATVTEALPRLHLIRNSVTYFFKFKIYRITYTPFTQIHQFCYIWRDVSPQSLQNAFSQNGASSL